MAAGAGGAFMAVQGARRGLRVEGIGCRMETGGWRVKGVDGVGRRVERNAHTVVDVWVRDGRGFSI